MAQKILTHAALIIGTVLFFGPQSFAGEILMQPQACLPSIYGGGNPFPHLSEPGRVPWTKINGIWHDTTLANANQLRIHSEMISKNRRAIWVEMLDSSGRGVLAAGEIEIAKDAREFEVELRGEPARLIKASFSVREIKGSQTRCAGRSVFMAMATPYASGHRSGKSRFWILGRAD